MKKRVELIIVTLLVMTPLASAVPVVKLGDINGAFWANNTPILAAGGTFDLYIWASNDIPVVLDDPEDPATFQSDTGLDNFQVFLQYNPAYTSISSVTKLSAVAGNPFGSVWYGRTIGTYNGLSYIEGALLPSINAGEFGLTKIAKLSLTVVGVGPIISLVPNASLAHQTKLGNSITGADYFSPLQSVLVPEPATLMLVGLGGILMAKSRKSCQGRE